MAAARHSKHDALVLYPHHRKPFRVHHIASLLVCLLLAFAAMFELGIMFDHGRRGPAPTATTANTVQPAATSPIVVRSAYGYSFSADGNTFAVSADTLDSSGQPQPVSQDQFSTGQKLVSATVKIKPGAASGKLAATQLSIRFQPDQTALTAAEQNPANKGLSPERVAASLFPVSASSELDVKTLSSAADTFHNQPAWKTVYQFTAKQGGGQSYAIQWSGVNKGRAYTIELNGLVGRGVVPGEFATVLDSLSISAGQAVLGASTGSLGPAHASADSQLDPKYLSDAISPAVVQIFHTVCGTLTVNGRALGSSGCVSFSGSGFLVTQSGYIATNGHVVVYSAKDALADLITSDQAVLESYLQGLGLSADQINAIKSDPAALAALVSKIYDLPDSQLHFADEGELTLVALGSEQPDVKKLAGLTSSAQLAQFRHDSASLKTAKVVGYNYDSKDTFTAVADPDAGFSSSDVALLKVSVANAPIVPIETGRVVQNEQIIVMGFPGDADNPLTDNNQTDVTVTDGVVSSIRQAAGDKGKLYQSDADASHGNSGGPAIDNDGKVIGLMTYRYADTDSGDAAESYIRDITDFTDLASDNNVKIDGRSNTQQLWNDGLELYSRNHYSAALKDFNKVEAAYPAQRLVASYITSSKDAIADGQNVQDPPVDVLLAILVLSLFGVGITLRVIIRHHGLHRVYQASIPDDSGQPRVVMAQPGVVPPAKHPAGNKPAA